MAFGDFNKSTIDYLELPDVEFVVAQDIAKKFDYTTTEIHRIVPVALDNPANGQRPRIYYFEDVVFRDKRQMKYHLLPEYTKELMQSMDLSNRSALLIDGTGIGEAVYDLYVDIGLDPIKIVFTSGNSPTLQRKKDTVNPHALLTVEGINVPKADLVGALQVYVQQGRLRQVEGLPFADEARRQFQNFVGQINELTKYTKYGNADEEVHDDMVVTAAMACWYTQHMKRMLSVKPPANPGDSTYNLNPFKEDLKVW